MMAMAMTTAYMGVTTPWHGDTARNILLLIKMFVSILQKVCILGTKVMQTGKTIWK